jgi:nucleoid-associated protein YgaU
LGIIDFVKSAGAMLGLAGDRPPDAAVLKQEVSKFGLTAEGLDVAVEGDTVKVAGKAPSQEIKEKIVLALGNVAGVAKVEDAIDAQAGGAAATFCTVKQGDTLSAIAKAHYGNANKYMAIFEANRPMLDHPDKIYPGQVLRIPPVA